MGRTVPDLLQSAAITRKTVSIIPTTNTKKPSSTRVTKSTPRSIFKPTSSATAQLPKSSTKPTTAPSTSVKLTQRPSYADVAKKPIQSHKVPLLHLMPVTKKLQKQTLIFPPHILPHPPLKLQMSITEPSAIETNNLKRPISVKAKSKIQYLWKQLRHH